MKNNTPQGKKLMACPVTICFPFNWSWKQVVNHLKSLPVKGIESEMILGRMKRKWQRGGTLNFVKYV